MYSVRPGGCFTAGISLATVFVHLLLDLGGIGLRQCVGHEAGLALGGTLAQLVNVGELCEPLVVEDLLEDGSLVSALLKQLYSN